MKPAFLIVISALALVGLLIADNAWPKESTAEEIPAAAPAVGGAATPEAASSSVPKQAVAEPSANAKQTEGASDQNMQGSNEGAFEHPAEPALGASTAEAPAD